MSFTNSITDFPTARPTLSLEVPLALDPLLTIAEVAVDLRCSRAHIYNVIKGTVHGVSPLPVLRIGRRKLIRRSSLERWKTLIETGSAGDILPALPGVSTARRMEDVHA